MVEAVRREHGWLPVVIFHAQANAKITAMESSRMQNSGEAFHERTMIRRQSVIAEGVVTMSQVLKSKVRLRMLAD